MRPINVEILMGHSTGISDSYYRPTETELLQDYLKAVDSLTISPERQLAQENRELKAENAEIEIIKKNYMDVKLTMEAKEKEIDNLNDVIAGLSDRLLQLEKTIRKDS
jgi:predicted  nucleic acid-binding Zn-ribbon protein